MRTCHWLDPVDAILAHHGIDGPWQPLKATGLANRIYATRDVVVRVATDHPEAIADARTESVADGRGLKGGGWFGPAKAGHYT